MIENFKGIILNNEIVKSSNLTFFEKESNKIILIFGKNGSGKTTISKSFSISKDNTNNISIEVHRNHSVYDQNDFFKKCAIFNENYIDKNLRIASSGPETIVLFGEQVEVEDMIKKYKEELDILEIKSTELTDEQTKTLDKKDKKSPIYYFERARDRLDDWANREKEIKGNKLIAKRADQKVNEIGGLGINPEEKEIILEKYNTLKNKLDNIKNPPEYLLKGINYIRKIEKYSEEKLISIVNKTIAPQSTSELSHKILALIENGNHNFIKESKSYFFNRENNICPFCFQDITDSHRNELLTGINQLLNKDTDDYQKELDSQRKTLQLIKDELNFIPTEVIKEIDTNISENVILLKEEAINKIESYTQNINQKYSNTFSDISISILSLYETIDKINIFLSEIEDIRNNLLKSLSKKEIQDELLILNNKLGCIDIHNEYNDYLFHLNEQKNLAKTISENQRKLCLTKQKLEELNMKKANTHIALDLINSALASIFLSDKRLSLEYNNNTKHYEIKSNNKSVSLQDISTGERNLIALIYFFVKLYENNTQSERYKKEFLIVIDDPVTSFDMENKNGIYSFISFEVNNFIKNNDNTRCIILTHDIGAWYDFKSIFRRLFKDSQINLLKLENKILKKGKYNNSLNVYRHSLRDIIHYLYSEDTEDLDYTIGNTCRKMLEAYLTFMLSKSIDGDISELREDLEKKAPGFYDYFSTQTDQVFMHTESHLGRQTADLQDNSSYFSFYSKDTKRKICKNILLLIYILTPYHLNSNILKIKDEIPVTLEKVKIDLSEFEKTIIKK